MILLSFVVGYWLLERSITQAVAEVPEMVAKESEFVMRVAFFAYHCRVILPITAP
jgi:hypothetical protein